MRDYEEKYLLIQRQFPEMAGKLAQLLATQKRQIAKLTNEAKKNKDVEAILLTSAETYDVGHEILDWMKQVLQGVLNDAEALKEGSKVRNALAFQSSIVEEWINRKA